jgi:hypothetical protein
VLAADATPQQPDAGPGAARDPRAVLAQAWRMHAAWAEITRAEGPPPLDRLVQLGRLSSVARARAMSAALAADLRVRPREYLRCAALIAAAPQRLGAWLLDVLRSVERELLARDERPGVVPPPALRAHAQDCARAIAADPLPRIWRAALVLSASGLVLATLSTGAIALLYLPVLLLLWPLRHAVDRVVYRRRLRAPLLDSIVAQGASAAEIVASLRNGPDRSLRRLAALAEEDAALELVGAIARLAHVSR